MWFKVIIGKEVYNLKPIDEGSDKDVVIDFPDGSTKRAGDLSPPDLLQLGGKMIAVGKGNKDPNFDVEPFRTDKTGRKFRKGETSELANISKKIDAELNKTEGSSKRYMVSNTMEPAELNKKIHTIVNIFQSKLMENKKFSKLKIGKTINPAIIMAENLLKVRIYEDLAHFAMNYGGKKKGEEFEEFKKKFVIFFKQTIENNI